MRYLFCSLSSFGFLLPSMGIAEALRRRGHEVAFVADIKVSDTLARAGFRRIPRGDPDGSSFNIELAGHPLDTMRQVRHVERALDSFAADVVVTQQLALGPYIAAERKSLPVATVGLATYLWPRTVPPDNESIRDAEVSRYRGFFLAYDVVRDMLGMEKRVYSFDKSPIIGDLFLLRSIPELEGRIEELPPQVHCVGDCLWELQINADPALTDWLESTKASGEPLIYVQPGRSFERNAFWANLVKVLRDQPIRVAAAVGRMDTETGDVPTNFFVRPHLPQSVILPYARGVISNATTTSTLGALSHGRPLLMIPGGGGAEQFELARRCVRSGAALYLPPSQSNEDILLDLIQSLLDRSDVREAAERMRDAFSAAGGPERAADLLETLGSQGTPMNRTSPTAATA